MPDETRATLESGVIWDDHGQGGIIVDMRRGRMSTLNATGIEVVRACQRGETLGSIARVLADKYGLEIESALSDVQEFVSSLAERGYLTRSRE